MRKDGTWGGQMEMNALANSKKFNIIVHQVGNPNMVLKFHEPMGSVPTIHLSYHLGKHYNSVRRIDDLVEPGKIPIIDKPIGHDLMENRRFINSLGMNPR
jgi:hypothetical protein